MDNISDESTRRIGAFTGEPIEWDRYRYEHFPCKPTANRYRVPRPPDGACPYPAPYAENPRCCTSEPFDDAEYIQMLRTVSRRILPRTLATLPPNIRRFVSWTRDLGNANHRPRRIIDIDELNPKFFDVVKFALLTKSNTTIRMMRNNGPFEVIQAIPRRTATAVALRINPASTTYPGLLRMLQDVSVHRLNIQLRNHPQSAIANVDMDRVRARNVTIENYDYDQSQLLDINDMVSFFKKNKHTGDLRAYIGCVYRASTSFDHEVHRLFQACHANLTSDSGKRILSVSFQLARHVSATGYVAPNTTDEILHAIGLRVMDDVVRDPSDNTYSYPYKKNNATELMKFGLGLQVGVDDELDTVTLLLIKIDTKRRLPFIPTIA